MKKKWIAAAAILAAILVCVLGFNALKPKTVAGAKTINVTVVSEIDGTELFSGAIKTDAETLGGMLEGAPELKAKMETSTYGRLLTALLDVEQGDMATGPWWLYESENNEACKTAGLDVYKRQALFWVKVRNLLKNPELQKKTRIQEQDERQTLIAMKTCSSALMILIGLAYFALLLSGMFNATVFFTPVSYPHLTCSGRLRISSMLNMR